MDDSKKTIIKMSIDKTIDNLKKNNMQAFYMDNCEAARNKVKELLKEGETVGCGGSVSLQEAGIVDILRSGNYNFLDRQAAKTREEADEIARKALLCDTFFSSSNAITEDGLLYNVDGFSNRIAGIVFGPKSVIIVAGYNKIVKNLDEAEKRVKSIAAPANCIRLNCETYCKETGECMSLSKSDGSMADGCRTEARICANFLISSKQRIKDRIKVIIVGEELGY